MSAHPPVADLLDRASEPEVAAHLTSCPSCRARARALGGLEAADLPGLEEARARLAEARREASSALSRSIGADGDDLPELEPGRDLGRYVVEAFVGRGGMGSVYRVRHTELGSLHALKLLHRASGSTRARLVREGRAQSRLRHPNVVPVTDIVEVDGAPGLVLEFVDGPSLDARLRQGPIPLPEADRLAQEILRAVGAAHAAGVVHRDLKPANVLLAPTDEGPTAKVADFGLARHLDGEPDLTRSNVALGTPAYMAPEQIRDASRADVRSDVFSLGALLYELVSGRRAFAGLDVADVFDRVRAGRYPPLGAEVPERMRATIARALRVDPAERFADCAAMLAAWRGAPSAPLATTGRSWRVPAAVAAAVASGLVGTAVVGLQGGEEPPPAVVTEHRVTHQPDDQQIYDMGLSPDGGTLAFVDGRGLLVQPVDEGAETLVLAGGFDAVDWFPDGQRLLASGTHDGRKGTWSVPIDGGSPTLLFGQASVHVRMSPQGDRVAMADERGVWVRDLAGGEPVRVRPVAEGDSTLGLAWSPSGTALASVHASPRGKLTSLEVRAVDGSWSRRLLEDSRLFALSFSPLAWLPDDTLLFGFNDHEGPRATLFALDGALSATDTSAAREVHAWSGNYVIRLSASADGRRIAVDHVTTDASTWLVALGDTADRRPLTFDDWEESPVGWLGPDELIVHSSRGRGLFRHRLDATAPTRVVADTRARRVDVVGDDLLFLPWGDGRFVRRAPLTGGAATDAFPIAPPGESEDAKRYYGVHCRSARCLVSRPEDERVVFRWVDATTGAESEPVASIARNARQIYWDVSPDERSLAVLTAHPARRLRIDLTTGEVDERPSPIDLPQAVAWSADGAALFVAGLSEDPENPYQLLRVGPDDAVEVLWSSRTWYFHQLAPSPDGERLGVAVHAFEGDVWTLEGLPRR